MHTLVPVDHSALRVNQSFVVLLPVLAYIFNLPWLVGLTAVIMLIGTILIKETRIWLGLHCPVEALPFGQTRCNSGQSRTAPIFAGHGRNFPGRGRHPALCRSARCCLGAQLAGRRARLAQPVRGFLRRLRDLLLVEPPARTGFHKNASARVVPRHAPAECHA